MIRLNLAKLINPQARTTLFDIQDYNGLWQNFYRCMSQALPDRYTFLTNLNNWDTRRIDYCIQFRVHDVETYIKLFQRGNKPYRGHYIIPYIAKDETDKNDKDTRHIAIDDELRKSHKPGSVYFVGGSYKPIPESRKKRLVLGSTIINIYDKQKEMKADKNKGRYTDKELAEAENILRIEIQCLSGKINTIAERYNLYKVDNGVLVKDKSLERYLSLDIARDILLTKYAEVCGKGNYYKTADVLKNITDRQSIRNKDRLKEIIKHLNGTGSGRTIWKEYERIKAKPEAYTITPEQYKKAIKKLNDEDINPITLKATYPIDELPSLYEPIQNYFNNLESQVYNDIITDFIDEEEAEESLSRRIEKRNA